MLNIQVFALTLIPLLAGVVPNEPGMPRSPLIGPVEEVRVMSDYMVGTWRCSDDFFRWGVTDSKSARVTRFEGKCLMTLRKDGTMKMENLFRPTEGRWEMTERGLAVYDEKYPKRGPQLLPVRKRDENRIWVLLPFAHGSNGIGMIRVTDEASAIKDPLLKKGRRTSRGQTDRRERRNRQ